MKKKSFVKTAMKNHQFHEIPKQYIDVVLSRSTTGSNLAVFIHKPIFMRQESIYL